MNAPLLFLLLFATKEPPPPASPAVPLSKTPCVICHLEMGGDAAEPAKHLNDDVHFQKGLGCVDCHGGDPTVAPDDISGAHDEKKGFRGKPKRLAIPVFCGACHGDPAYMKRYAPQVRTDQLAEYRTSVHGKRSAMGDEKAAVCVDCHGVHGIRPVKDAGSTVYKTRVAETCAKCHADAARMASYGIPTNQYADYKSSVHAKALYDRGDTSVPTCNDCHGSHGAAPPGLTSVTSVCGSCHGREASLFRETEAKKGLQLERCIQCIVCHGNHAVKEPTDDMFGMGPRSTCSGCHPAGTPIAAKVSAMESALTALRTELSGATALLDRAERAGVEVGPDRFELQKARDRLVELRVLAHSFDAERFVAASAEGRVVAQGGTAAGKRALDELKRRRQGLGFSLLVIVAVIGGLVATVRRLERSER